MRLLKRHRAQVDPIQCFHQMHARSSRHTLTSMSSLTSWLSVVVNHGPPRSQQVLPLAHPCESHRGLCYVSPPLSLELEVVCHKLNCISTESDTIWFSAMQCKINTIYSYIMRTNVLGGYILHNFIMSLCQEFCKASFADISQKLLHLYTMLRHLEESQITEGFLIWWYWDDWGTLLTANRSTCSIHIAVFICTMHIIYLIIDLHSLKVTASAFPDN